MPRRATPPSPRSARMLAAWAGVLIAVLGAPALPAHASDIPDWPAGSWPSCADAQAQYCIEEATVTPLEGVATPVAELGLQAGANTLDGYVRSFNWSIGGWEGEGISEEVRRGDVSLVIRTGVFMPRYTFALAQGMRVTRSTDDAGNTTMTVTGRAVHIDWTTGDLFGACVAGSDCGGLDTMADPLGTGYRFMGNTQDLEVWGEEAMETLDGMYLASDAQARPVMVNFGTYPEPYWSLQVLGNPHLDVNGNPVRGSFNAWLPPAYFASLGTTPTDAAAVGFDVVSSEGGTSTSVPATVAVQDSGVGIDVADLGYSMHQIDVYSRPSPVSVGDTVPDAPGQVVAAGADGAVDVSWAAPGGDGGSPVSGYTVRAFSEATGGSIAGRCTAATTSCTITGLTNGTTYHLAVTASNAFGEGAPQPERAAATAAVPTVAVPSVPQAVALAPGNGTLTATWQEPASIGGSAVTGYSVKAYPTAEGGSPVKTCSTLGAGRTCNLTGLVNGTVYHVAVTATNAIGAGPAAGLVSAAPRTIPSVPQALQATPGAGSLGVTWNAPASTGGSPITGYTASAYLAASGGSPVNTCTAVAPVRACSVTGLTNGTPYYVSVAATNAAGAGPQTTRVTGTPRTVPSVAQAVAVNPGNASLGVTWQAPASTGGPSVTGYSVRAYPAAEGGSAVKTCTAVAAARTCNLSGLINGTVYHVAVTATNALGVGAEHTRVAGTPRTTPAAASGLALAAADGSLDATWNAPVSTGGSPITGYTVAAYRAKSGGTPVKTCTSVAPLQACSLTGLTNGTVYYVAVTAANAAGPSRVTAVRVSATPRTRPTVVRSVTAVSTGGKVKVGWALPLSTGGSALTGFQIAVYDDPAAITPVTQCSAAASARTCTTGVLTVGQTYHVTVTATNVAGASVPSTPVAVLVKP